MNLRVLLTCLVFAASAVVRGEDGYDLWLRYRVIPSAEYPALATQVREIVGPERSPTLGAAARELSRGLSGLTGREIPRSAAVTQPGAVLLTLSQWVRPTPPALDTFENLGAAPWAERARLELRASGQAVRRRDPSTLLQLTPQELQVARFVATGLPTREVAAQLFLSPRTVEFHLRNVFAKLGISSRSQLAQFHLD